MTAANVPQIRVEPLVEQGRHDVRHEVHLELAGIDWRMLVGDFAARIQTLREQGRPITALLAGAGRRPCDADQQAALTELLSLLAGPTHIGSPHSLPPTWAMTPEAAVAMAGVLDDAANPPVECHCGRAVPRPSQLTDECDVCTDSHRHLRSVGGI